MAELAWTAGLLAAALEVDGAHITARRAVEMLLDSGGASRVLAADRVATAVENPTHPRRLLAVSQDRW